jgi:hypothetical protein
MVISYVLNFYIESPNLLGYGNLSLVLVVVKTFRQKIKILI